MKAMRAGTIEEARVAKATAKRTFSRFAPVVGVGITRIGGGFGLKVNLASKPRAGAALPVILKGVPVRVEVTGPIRAR